MQQAQIRLYQVRVKDALALLRTPPSQFEVTSQSTEVKRETLLAIACTRSNDLPHAEEALSRAKRLCSTDADRAGVLMAEGVIEGEHGRLDNAERAFELSLASARSANDPLQQAQALLNLGVAALRKEHYEDALGRFDEASHAARSIGAGLVLMKATGSVGSTYRKLGDYRNAIVQADEARRQAERLGVASDQGRWLEDIGLSQARLGDLAAARASYDKAFQLETSVNNQEALIDTRVSLGYLSLEAGDVPAALAQAREATALAESRRNETGMFQPLLLEARSLARGGAVGEARAKLLALDHRTQSKPSVQWEVESAAAHLFVATGDPVSAGQWFQRAIDTFDRQRTSFRKVESKLPFLENGTDLYLDYMEQLIREGRTNDALAVLDRSRAEILADGLGLTQGQRTPGVRLSQPAALAARLHGTILVYSLRPTQSYLWAFSPTQSAFYRLPGRDTILSLVDRHRAAILASKDLLAGANSPAQALYDLLVAPAASLIAPQGRVFVIADQGLHRLNFETLLTPARRFFIEDAIVTNAPSLSVLSARSPAPSRDPRNLLLIGDPIYSGGGRAELPNASHEAATIASQFPAAQRTVLTGAQAVPAAYAASDPSRFAYIHFVAHGTASEQNPLDSAVILSPPAGHPEAFKLYARGILDSRLHAQLVTISTCYGSGSRAYAGEGLVGLAWAFLRAGSHNVIGSLWEISDASTPELMSRMYAGINAGSPPDAALRDAKLAMLHTSGAFRKPFYWAPFQLYAGA